MATVPEALREALSSLAPGATVESVSLLSPDVPAGETEKAVGYGKPLRVTLRETSGARRDLVFRTASGNEFGHDRRADRAEELLLAFDLFNRIPAHVPALDVGAIAADGRLVSLRGAGEFYLVTGFARGTLYAEDLRRVARDGAAGPLDLARCDALVAYLAGLHAEKRDDPAAWRRAVRDLVGHGEGIFGMVDGYPPDTPAAPPERLRCIEERCLSWRWRLRGRAHRLARTHGDFHPFNLVFGIPGGPDAPPDLLAGGQPRPSPLVAPLQPGAEATHFTALDASRGGQGDPADDVTALTINYVFFALEHHASWAHGLGVLWRRFWERYLAATGDAALLESAPPFLAWRALVLASPRFYPRLPAPARDAVLGLAERALEAGRLDPASAEALFTGPA
ncbi:MAG TPA: phosphotransferase [Anaeromyxobacteraceae bacterium]|nr:phosphotransferase [Anaeromyxobacteraceae bacterium]